MPRWRFLHSMAQSADQPQRDHYDGNTLVAPHFAISPDLVPVDVAYECYGEEQRLRRWKPVAQEIRSQARMLYRMHHLDLCTTTRAGLFIAGTLDDLKNPDRDRMMILVFELDAVDITRWQDIDADVRGLLVPLESAQQADHGICVRYYVKDTLPTPIARSHIRLTDSLRNNGRLLSPLRDPYVEEHPSVRRMSQVRLPTGDSRRRQQAALPPIAATNLSADAALQRRAVQSRANAEPSHSDSSDSVDPPDGRSGRTAARRRPRSEPERKEDEAGSESDSETDPQARSIARRYRRLARRIDREHQYNLKNMLNDAQGFMRMMNILGLDTSLRDDTDTWSNDGIAGVNERREDVEPDSWSGVDSDPEGLYASDAGEDDERLGAEMLPRIDERDLPAARNRALAYLRQLTACQYERYLGGGSR